MTDSSATTVTPSSPKRPKKSVWARILIACLLGIVLLGAFLVGMLHSDRGSALLWKTAVHLSGDTLQGQYESGSFAKGVTLRDLQVRTPSADIRISQLDSDWDLQVFSRIFTINTLQIGDVDVTLKETEASASSGLPERITLPLSLHLNAIRLANLRLHQQGTVTSFSALQLHANSDQVQHALTIEHLTTPYGEFIANLQLNGQRPFNVTGQAALTGTYTNEPYQIKTQLNGSLEELLITLGLHGDKLNGSARIAATPFADVPFKQIHIDLQHLNPHMFGEGLPVADIAIKANLNPASAEAATTVTGDIEIMNTLPGTIDRARLPVRSARAKVSLSPELQSIDALTIHLLQQASIVGSGKIIPPKNAQEALAADLTLDIQHLDLQALHTSLQASKLNGPITLKMANQIQTLTLNLKDKIYDIGVNLTKDAEKIQLNTLRLAAHKATLELQGQLATTEKMDFAVTGNLRKFDPSLWIKGGNKHAQAAISMQFETQGRMHPLLDIAVKYQILPNSRYAGLPTTGKGDIHIVGQELRPSEANINIAGNAVVLKGSFGRPNEQMHVKIDAPYLSRLGFGTEGELTLNGKISGSSAAFKATADVDAKQVKVGDYALTHLHGSTQLQADLTKGLAAPSNKIAANIVLADLSSPQLNLGKLDLTVNGSSAQHTIALHGDGALSGKPLQLTLAAQGKITANPSGYGWSGVLSEFENHATPNGLPRIVLGAPLSIQASPDNLALGNTQLTIGNAKLALNHFQYRHGSIKTEGSANDLYLANIQQILKELAGVTLPIKTNLVLDGAWNIALDRQAHGFITLKRREGDLSIASGSAYVPLEISDLDWRIDFKQSQMHVNAITSANKIGQFKVNGHLNLQQENGVVSLGPQSTLALTSHLLIPKLSGIGNLLGPQYSLRGKIDTQLQITGKLAHPLLSGTINGNHLSFTLLDEGITLQKGTIRAVLDRNLLTVEQFAFQGGDGTLTMTGQVKLDDSDEPLEAKIVADKLEIFASPDRQLMLSGSAVLAKINQRLHLNGKIVVDQAQFDIPKESAPKLSDDVIIIDPNKPELALAKANGDNAFSPIININVNLGNRFKFKGAGADLSLTGDLTISREQSSSLHSTGTIYARGNYESFGVKLDIERGLINFQGPLTNPSLNILAMRRNQEIAAGVEVTGNANQPRIRLVSEPNVSDEEKLSWMMFGRGSDSSSTSEFQARNQALALLGNYGGKKIAQEFGIDEFSIGASETGSSTDQVVNIGKIITNKITVGIEKALTAPDGVAKFTWNISRRWSLVARGGTINGFTLLFNKRWD